LIPLEATGEVEVTDGMATAGGVLEFWNIVKPGISIAREITNTRKISNFRVMKSHDRYDI
jgi:hypothetical protein